METHDVVVVGGGPAGSTCAWQLRQHGVDVLVLDKRSFPRDKTCAGWITPGVVEALNLDLADYRNGRILQPITGFRTGMQGGREVETRYDMPVSYGILRLEFDHYLLGRAQAPCRLGEPLTSLDRSDGMWILNGTLRAPMLVGAGGNFCPVARMLGNDGEHAVSSVVAQEIEYRAEAADLARSSVNAETPELFFCDDLQGYGWCFRKGDHLNIGLGRTDRVDLQTHVHDFVDFLRARGKVCGPIPDHFHGHAYRLYERSMPRLFDDGVLLVGDSAGLADPTSGEGIRAAVESGRIAAATILNAGGTFDASRLAPYRDRILERFGRPRRSGGVPWLPAGCLRFLAKRLLASQWFSRRVVLDHGFLRAREPLD